MYSLSKLGHFLRPFQRLFSARLRLVVLVFLLLVVIVYTARKLNANDASAVNQMNSYEFADHLPNLKEYLHYAVLIDAGSSGSRVHIYVWPPHSGDKRRLLQIRYLKDDAGVDIAKRISPGLSSCYRKPSSASDYVKPLLQFAAKHVPESKHKETPLFILATAGMRLLDLPAQESILDDLRKDVPTDFQFHFPPNHAQVITGKEEGIYSWIAVNYLMGRFDHSVNAEQPVAINLHNAPITTRQRTIGMLEMGGASVQIAFEITSKYELEEIKQRRSVKSTADMQDVLAEFNLGCSSHDTDHSYLLYVTTYLGLGANVARETYLKTFLTNVLQKSNVTSPLGLPKTPLVIVDPCLTKESVEKVNITLASGELYELTVEGAGNFDVCKTKLLEFLDPKREADSKCSINSSSSCPLKQLLDTRVSFTESEFYGFSELWYTLEDVLRLGGQYNYFNFKKAASEYCNTKWSVLESRYTRKLYPKADRDRLVHECFKSVWVMALLHDGLRMPTSYSKYKSVSSLKGSTVQWTLGALLYRTRFFPLAAVEARDGVVVQEIHVHAPAPSNFMNHFLFLLCMALVIASIVVYLKHLHRLVNSTSLIGVTIKHPEPININDSIESVQIDADDRAPLLDVISS